MPVVKRINHLRYWGLTGLSTLCLAAFFPKSPTLWGVLAFFALATFLNHLMLLGALAELLATPVTMRRMDRFTSRAFLQRRAALLSDQLRKDLGRHQRETPRLKRRMRLLVRGQLKRRMRSWSERRYLWNSGVRRKNWKIVGLVLGKILILAAAIGLGVHFIGDKIIVPVINYVIQILALALSVKRGHR